MTASPERLAVTMVSDFVCPWCWLGKSRLDAALRSAGLTRHEVAVTYWPFELNPDMPPGGMDRRAYRTAKFGSWEASQALDARIMAEAAADGIPFAFDRITRTPSTHRAHRLLLLTQHTAPAAVEPLVTGIFRAYFVDGHDIGDAMVLEALLRAALPDDSPAVDALLRRLAAGEADRTVADIERRLQGVGVSGVPLFVIGGRSLPGAQPVAVLADALQAACQV